MRFTKINFLKKNSLPEREGCFLSPSKLHRFGLKSISLRRSGPGAAGHSSMGLP